MCAARVCVRPCRAQKRKTPDTHTHTLAQPHTPSHTRTHTREEWVCVCVYAKIFSDECVKRVREKYTQFVCEEDLSKIKDEMKGCVCVFVYVCVCVCMCVCLCVCLFV